MSFTYTEGGTSSLNRLRLAVGDTNATYPLFTDNEINGVLTRENNDMDHAKGVLLGVLAVDPIRLMQSHIAISGAISLLDEMETYDQLSKQYTD